MQCGNRILLSFREYTMPIVRLKKLMIFLDEKMQELYEKHYKAAPRNGIPIGGGDWMDTFFRTEAIRGCLGALRRGKNLEEAIQEGITVSEISVGIWNKKREWQVHRWEKTGEMYLRDLIRHWRALDKIDQERIRKEEWFFYE